MRELLNNKKYLRNIQVLSLSNDFINLSKEELISLKNDSESLITKIGGTDDNETFFDIEKRINNRLSEISSSFRFKVQLYLSIAILIVTLFGLGLQLYSVATTEPRQPVQKIESK